MAVFVYNGTNSNVTCSMAGAGQFSTGSTASGIPFRSNGKNVGIDHVDDISASFTIPAGYNHGAFGPMTIESGYTVTVSTGATFTVV